MATVNLSTISRAEFESRLAAMEGPGITPLSWAAEALDALAAALLEPFRHDDMRPSEVGALQEVGEQAGDQAMAAARTAIIDRLSSW